MDKKETILVTTREKVGLITMNRPKSYNALNPLMLSEIMKTLASFDQDQTIGAMILTGGDKVFAAGADISHMSTATTEEMEKSTFIPTFDHIRNINKPIIAVVSGYCLGGGCELALSCDMIIASETAKFGQPEISLGIIPGAGGTQRLPRTLGKFLAMEMVLDNRMLSADEALSYHLVNYVHPLETYFEKAVSLASSIANRAPVAVQAGKEMVNQAYETQLAEGLEEERSVFYHLFSTEDQKEGMEAFLEKREPRWKGK